MIGGRKSKPITHNPLPIARAEGAVPWESAELRRFWGLARKAGLDTESVRGMLFEHYGKTRLHDLTRREFLGAMSALLKKQDMHHGWSSADQWEKIKWLQRRLGWTDRHLENFIKRHRQIDSIRFLDVPAARDVITAMEKIRRWNESKR